MQRLILITGMHRSGTSAAARWLNLLGVDLGTDLKTDQPEINPHGFWEHPGVVDLNERILAALRSTWYDHRPFPERWWVGDRWRPFRREIRELIQRDLNKSPLAGVKDPRLSRLLPLWRSALRPLKRKLSCLLILRDPGEAAASLEKRDGFGREAGLLLWLEYVRAAEYHSRSMDRAIITYEQLLADPAGLARRVADELSLPWPRQPEEIAERLTAEIDSRWRHHRCQPEEAASDPTLETARALYRCWTDGGAGSEGRLPLPLSAARRAETLDRALFEAHRVMVHRAQELTRIGELHSRALAVIEERDRQLNAAGEELARIGTIHREALETIRLRDRERSGHRQRLQAAAARCADLEASLEKLERQVLAAEENRRRLRRRGQRCSELLTRALETLAAQQETLERLRAEQAVRRSRSLRKRIAARLRPIPR